MGVQGPVRPVVLDSPEAGVTGSYKPASSLLCKDTQSCYVFSGKNFVYITSGLHFP